VLEFDFWKALLRIMITLPIVLVMAYFTIKLVFGRKTMIHHKGSLQIIEQISLGNRAFLVITKVADDYYLLGVTEQQIQLLSKLTGYKPVEGLSDSADKFSHLLAKLTKKGGERSK